MSAPDLDTPFELPCGATIQNRFFKSAMSEQLADRAHDPTPRLVRLYRTWAEGGVGLQVTGNVMVLSMLDVTWYEAQLERLSRGAPARADLGAWRAVAQVLWRVGLHAFTPLRA